jgi:uncharacterized protein (TIGR00369 family)
MTVWTRPISVEELTAIHHDTAVQHLGIEFLEVGPDFIRARVPVDTRTKQPYGLLHGGVSVVLAETLGSCGAAYSCPEGHRAVGLDINANHLKGATSGWVTGQLGEIDLKVNIYRCLVTNISLFRLKSNK